MNTKARKARRDARIKEFEAMAKFATRTSRNGRTIHIGTASGKTVAYHRPGSLSK